MPDHLHLLLEMEVPDRFTSIVRDMKSGSSLFLKKRFNLGNLFAWQEGYGSFSVSQSSLEKVKSYIQNQKHHHATLSFEEEFRLIFRKHQIAYDERYVLG